MIDSYSSNGFLALEETLHTRRKGAVGLARAYAKGTIFTITNPEAAVRILCEVFPAQKPTGFAPRYSRSNPPRRTGDITKAVNRIETSRFANAAGVVAGVARGKA